MENTASNQVLAHVLGYLIKDLYWSKTKCVHCCAALESIDPVEEIYGFIQDQGTSIKKESRTAIIFLSNKIFITDRGGLRYPTMSFIARFLTIQKFIRSVIQRLKGRSLIRNGLVSFLLPYVTSSTDLTCYQGLSSRGRNGINHKTKIIRFIMAKFIGTIVSDHAQVWTQEVVTMKPIVNNKPEKRKALKMRKTQ